MFRTDLKCPFCGMNVYLASKSETEQFVFTHETNGKCFFEDFKISWKYAKSLKEAKEIWNRITVK